MRRDRQIDLLVGSLPLLSAYVRRIAGDRQTASEILQEVSVRILAGQGPDEPERFLAYCCGIARHVLARDWRMRRRARAELPLEGELLDEIRAPASDFEGRVDARAWMARVVGRVDHAGLELLVRRYVLEESGSDLADEMAQSSAALRMRLMRLRTALLPIVPGRWRRGSPAARTVRKATPVAPPAHTAITLRREPPGPDSASLRRGRAAVRQPPSE